MPDMLVTARFPVSNPDIFKKQLLSWVSRFSSCCFLDSHGYQTPWMLQNCLAAAGSKASIHATTGKALNDLQEFIQANEGQWIFGHLGFELFAETEQEPSGKKSEMGFDDLHFFVPQIVVQLEGESVMIMADSLLVVNEAFQTISAMPVENPRLTNAGVFPKPVISREQYLEKISLLKEHILRGDCYEINYCQEFIAEQVVLQPAALYSKLSQISPNPFSCFYRQGAASLACASPERFLRKQQQRLLCQPIKGTAQRHLQNAAADEAEKQLLQQSEKDKRENVMVVDLVRNDLSKVCIDGSVIVEELYGVYTYPQVHQMISTVVGIQQPNISFTDIIRATFPMGSMTGAPKKRVLQLINEYEPGARGLFSGSVGYIQPNGDFDFNVVIRSVQYNEVVQRLSFHVGSGITWYSQPEWEYEECLWKAAAILQVLQPKK